jgi:hypothetical protein
MTKSKKATKKVPPKAKPRAQAPRSKELSEGQLEQVSGGSSQRTEYPLPPRGGGGKGH